MKKLLLLGALVCAGQMYGMEKNPWEELPTELQREIVNTALVTNKSVDDVINTIKAFGTLYGVHYDTQTATDLLMKTLPNDLDQAINKTKNLGTTLQDFTKLVHVLADKFDMTTQDIAEKFKTPIAEKYVKLGEQLLNLMNDITICARADINDLINKGADVNFDGTYISYSGSVYQRSPLLLAIVNLNVPAVKNLLGGGVKISDNDLRQAESMTGFSPEEIKRWRQGAKGGEAKTIYKLLLEAELKKLEEAKAMEK